jgi:hypothetical protein
MAARFERSCNENEQVVWLSESDPSIEETPFRERACLANPLSRLYYRNIESPAA